MKENILTTARKQFQNIVWEGRFQPIHRGHLEYINKLMSFGRLVYIVVVANEMSSEVCKNPEDLPVRFFSEVVDPHHRPEKNIFPYALRYRMVLEAIKECFGADAPIIVMSGRRLDLAWDLYRKILPAERVFITPMRDAFEDVKARAWQTLGETNYRVAVDDLPDVSATRVREALQNRSREALETFLMPSTLGLLKENNYI